MAHIKYPGKPIYFKDEPDTQIYFIQMCPPIGPIKIGIAKDIKNRLLSLQTGSPYDLKLLYYFNGDINYEKELHRYWDYYRMNGEWFHPCDGILKFIEVYSK